VNQDLAKLFSSGRCSPFFLFFYFILKKQVNQDLAKLFSSGRCSPFFLFYFFIWFKKKQVNQDLAKLFLNKNKKNR
jgi:hypothetical protein